MPDESPACLTAALDYLARGWSPLPLCPADHVGVGKAHRGCNSPGKRPFFPDVPEGRSGEWKEYQATAATDERVRKWWDAHPLLNVGLALGPVSGLVGVDVDDEEGDALLYELSGGEIPPTLEYSTGKGRRLLFALPAGVTVTNHQFRRPGTEIEILRFMSQGGQVVMPPSKHPNGAVYRWKTGHAPGDLAPAPAPDWMRSLKGKGEAFRPADGELITEGGRNNYLTSLAGAMRKRGADEEAIFAALKVTSDNRFDPPLNEHEVRTVARSVARYEPDEYTGVTFTVPDKKAGPMPAVVAGERRFKWMSELSTPDKADEWIWEGYLPKGGIALLSALWKAGKTTLLAHLLKALGADGTFLGQKITAAKVLYVSEEGERHWVRRRDNLNIGNHAGMYLQPFGVKPDAVTWMGFVHQLRKDIEEHQFDLVVFDTLAKLWPVVEENDAGAVDAALMPLWELTKAGAGVLLIHHLRKSGGTEYTGSRGSGALSAFPDIIIELTRFDSSDAKSRKRVLKAKGRYDETPDELVIELAGDEYRHVTEPGEIGEGGTVTIAGMALTEEQKVLAVLTDNPEPWMGIETIRAAIKARFAVGIRFEDVNTHLFSLFDRKTVVVRGKVRSKADPRQYALAQRVTDVTPDATSHSTPECQRERDAGNEMETDIV